MIQYLLFVASKLLNISDIAKKIGSFFKLPIQLFYGVPYPELALFVFFSYLTSIFTALPSGVTTIYTPLRSVALMSSRRPAMS